MTNRKFKFEFSQIMKMSLDGWIESVYSPLKLAAKGLNCGKVYESNN